MPYKSYILGSTYTSWGKANKNPMDPNREPMVANWVTETPLELAPNCFAMKLWLNLCVKSFSS